MRAAGSPIAVPDTAGRPPTFAGTVWRGHRLGVLPLESVGAFELARERGELEHILSDDEITWIAGGSSGEVIDGRVGFQTGTLDEFTAALERLPHRRVVAFSSANQTAPVVACELFFLDAAQVVIARAEAHQ